jgi:hypothetical protein
MQNTTTINLVLNFLVFYFDSRQFSRIFHNEFHKIIAVKANMHKTKLNTIKLPSFQSGTV